ncbi:ExbD/TolR family protein [Yoonia sp. MH D7]
MAIRSAQSRRKGISMTSLIDVIFLLLLFFMLSSTFSQFSEIQLFAANAGTSGSATPNAPLFVRLSEDAVQLNGQEFDLTTLNDGITALRNSETQTVVIAPQKDTATAQRLVDTLVVLAKLPDLNIVVLE